MYNEIMKNLETLISIDRLTSYKGVTKNDIDALIIRYNFNIELCKSLYPSLHLLEIALRNTLHISFSSYLKDPDWMKNYNKHTIFQNREKDKIKEAIDELKTKKRPITEGRIIAELSFGFWANLYDRPYTSVHLQTIKDQFPNATNAQRDIFKIKELINNMRILRNRIFHYEPIWHWPDLDQRQIELKNLITWMNQNLLLSSFVKSEKEFLELIGRQGLLKK